MRGVQQPWRALCVISLWVVQRTSGNIISQFSNKYLATITCNLHAYSSAHASIHSRFLRMSQRRIDPAHEQTRERQRASGRCRHLKQRRADCHSGRTPTMAHRVFGRRQRPLHRAARRCTAVCSSGRTCRLALVLEWPQLEIGSIRSAVSSSTRSPFGTDSHPRVMGGDCSDSRV